MNEWKETYRGPLQIESLREPCENWSMLDTYNNFYPFLHRTATFFCDSHPVMSYGDYMQEGYLALCYAMERFDRGRPGASKFSSFAIMCIRCWLIDKAWKYQTPCTASAKTVQRGKAPWRSNEDSDRVERYDSGLQWVDVLDEIEAEGDDGTRFALHSLLGYYQKEIVDIVGPGTRVGTSTSSVSRSVSRAERGLRHRLKETVMT